MTAAPYVRLFDRVVASRLAPRAHTGQPQALQLDQFVNVALGATALLTGLVGLTWVFYIAVIAALANSIAMAATGYCAGTVLYTRLAGVRTRVEAELAATPRSRR